MRGETSISLLRRLIDAAQGTLPPAVAEAILQVRFAEQDQARMTELASKNNLGSITPEELAEYDGYIAEADLLSVWKAKARVSLKQHPSAA